MKRLLICLVTGLLLPHALVAQCANEWAQQLSALPNGMLGGHRLTVALDGNDNIYLSNVIVNAQSLTAGGQSYSGFSADALSNSAYVARLHSSGQFSWLRVFEGEGLMSVLDISADSEGNVYVAGYATEKVTIDMVEILGPGPYQPGYFIAKLDSFGNVVWVRSTDFPSSRCSAIEWTEEGLAFGIAYTDSVMVGSEIIYEDASSSANHQDVVFGVLNSDGEVISMVNIGGSGDIDIASLKCNDISCLLQGKFSEHLSYSDIELTTSGSLHFSLYQLSLSFDGEVNWSNATTNTEQLTILSHDIGFLDNGDAFFTGGYGYSSITMDNLTVNEPSQVPGTFIGKVGGASGTTTLLTEISANGQGWNKPMSVHDEHVLIGGSFNNSHFILDDLTIANSESGSYDGVILSLDKDGGLRCGMGVYGEGDNEIRAIEYGSDGHLVILVTFNGTVEFGGQTYTALGNFDLLVVKTCLPCDTLVSIAEASTPQPTLLIYPNPARQSIRVEATGSIQPTAITITDMLGHAVLHQQTRTHEQHIDISGLANGIYALTATLHNGETRRARLVVQR